ncbi:SAM-dependent methyltransferase [Streptomyces fructofermentans]|uniref:SAM-dependent methyltransferase n=1 Tax=Streptomyces fructofermentans TaxID=152141 RepID=UPI0037BA1B1C
MSAVGREAADEGRGWRPATEEALYGPRGFYRRAEGPAGHFRTSVHASALFARAVARLLGLVDESLGRPAELAFVDMGAGRGELVTGVLGALPAEVASRVRPYAVERAARPPGLDHRIEWLAEPPAGVTGLLFANEWLDNVPVDVAEADSDGVVRLVRVRADGSEFLGAPVTGADARWLARWWPLTAPGGPAAPTGPTPAALPDPSGPAAPSDPGDSGDSGDSGGPGALGRSTVPGGPGDLDGPGTAHETDVLGASGGPGDPEHAGGAGHGGGAGGPGGVGRVGRVGHGREIGAGGRDGGGGLGGGHPSEGLRAEIGLPRDVAWAAAVACLDRGLAVAVDYAHSAGARPPFGTLTGFRDGRETAPVPDGSCDITAHVALDACALPGARLLSQREALRALGVHGGRPPLRLASTDPAAYVRALAGAGEAAELTAPGGLGGFGWLLQPVGIADPLAHDLAHDSDPSLPNAPDARRNGPAGP